MKEEKTVIRTYLVKISELRQKLDLKGEVVSIQLWRGRSPNQVGEGMSSDAEVYEIKTEEKG